MKFDRCVPGARPAGLPPSQRLTWWCGALALLTCGLVPDRARADLLVIGPHPDDDIITSAGVILRARQAGESVRVVLMTNGDIAGEASGLLRQDEAIDALQALQVPEDHVIFLGYPDGHLADLRSDYADGESALATPWGSTATYGARGLGRSDYHSHAFGAAAANNGANVTADLAHLLSRFQPGHIFLTSEFDLHPDHSATYHFVIAALASVMRELPSYDPTLHQTIVWNDGSAGPWPPAPAPDGYFDEPPGLYARSGLAWSARESLDVPLEMQRASGIENLKWRAIEAHASQGGNHGYIGGFLHKDEFFWSAQARAGNRPPVPHAGADRDGAAGAPLVLDGSGSFDPDGTALGFLWRQTAGPPATLSSASAAQPTLIVPPEAGVGTLLAFELVVSDGTYTSARDAVSVRVAAALDPAQDAGVQPDAAVAPPADAAVEPDAGPGPVVPEPADAATDPADAGVPSAPEPADAAADPADTGAPSAPEPADAATDPPDAGAPADAAARPGDASNTPVAPEPGADADRDGRASGASGPAPSADPTAPAALDPGAEPEATALALDPETWRADALETQAEAVATGSGAESDKGASMAAGEAGADAGSGCSVTSHSPPASLALLYALCALLLARRRAG